MIFAERDRKLNTARERRRVAREAARAESEARVNGHCLRVGTALR